MSRVSYGPYQGGDEAALVACWNRSMPKDQVSLGRFIETTLLDGNFDELGLIEARDERGEVRGFAHAVTYRQASAAAGAEGPPGGKDGWLSLLVVDPGYRRQGMGSELMSRAEGYLASQGCSRIVVSPYPPAYYYPGVPAGRYPGSTEFFDSRGYRRGAEVVAMDVSLAGYEMPEDVHKAKHRLKSEGWKFGGATPSVYTRLVQLCREFTDDWADVMLTALRYWADPSQVQVAVLGDKVAGFAIFGAFHGCADRFGPFGVSTEFRRSGIGNVILHDTLREMASRSLHSAWFLWTGEDDAAGRLYKRAGFEVTRRFAIYEHPLVARGTVPASLGGAQASPGGAPSAGGPRP